jgi:predicted methyltransferase
MTLTNRSSLCVLSHIQTAPILKARQDRLPAMMISTDLGLTTAEVRLHPDRVSFANGQDLAWVSIEEINANETACFYIENNSPRVIRGYSEAFERFYSLMPTESAPTMLISGIPMHRIKGTNPYLDTLSKIKAIAPVGGHVLDTTTGLGYTAIEAARMAVHVVTIELDPVALGIARLNPWSQSLFNNPKITQVVGDSFEEIAHFEAGSFSCIIHDPPTFSLAGELYSAAFYKQAFRVLKHRGRMFHYIGDPNSKSGARLTKGVIRRLQESGFTRVSHAPQAFGVIAYKE